MRLLSRSDNELPLLAVVTEILLTFDGISHPTDEYHRMTNAGTLMIRDKLLVKLREGFELTEIESISLALIISLHNASRANR